MHLFQYLAASIAVRLHFKAEAMRREATDVLDELAGFAAEYGAPVEHLANYQFAELRLALADFLDTLGGWEVPIR